MFKIALVGSPNVGKSTLFNKFIGGRRSIVEDKPGVTRDRIYADVNLGRFHHDYNSLPVQVIDTGGLFFTDDTLYEGVQKQAFSSVEEANCVLFVVDGRVGVTQTDRLIADHLHKSKTPVILLVNKVDSDVHEHLTADFYSLGFKDVLSFSSLGENFKYCIQNLIDKLVEDYNLNPENTITKKSPDLPKITLMGKPNTGKSSLLNQLAGYERSLVHNEAGTTRDALDTYLTFNEKEILLIDTAGLRRKTKVHEDIERYSVDRSIKALVRADVCVLVIDVTDGISHQEQKLASLIQKRYKGCVLVLNKWDLIEEKDYEKEIAVIRRDLGFVGYAPVVITSAKTGQRVKDIIQKSLEVHENLHKTIKTNLLNTVLRELMLIRNFSSKLKIYYITQTGTNPVSFVLFVNDPKHLHPHHLQFLERTLREEFGFEGVPIKWDIRKSKNNTRDKKTLKTWHYSWN